MNKERILELADAVEGSGTFTMNTVAHWEIVGTEDICQSPACIDGHCCDLWPLDDMTFAETVEYYERGLDPRGLYYCARALDISAGQAKELCEPKTENFKWSIIPSQPGHITNQHAAACLRNLAATGKVDWEGTAP